MTTWSDLFSKIIVTRIEPHLGHGRLTLLSRYPIAEAALARPCGDDPRFAERFEMYACGVELANGFGELTDAAEQRRRFVADMDAEGSGSMASATRSTRTSSPPWRTMPEPAAWRWGSTGWRCWHWARRHINDVIWTPFPA